MKPSRFNIFVDLDEGRKLLFNSVSGALAELTPESHAQVADILSAAGTQQMPANKELTEQLTYGGFLVDDEVDEIAELKVADSQRRFGNSLLSLGICPTFECNLSCPYCEGRKMMGRMTRAAEKALLRFTELYVRKCDMIELTWLGGEPLLCVETIERIQAGVDEQAQKYGVQLLGSTVITNGVLLDADIAKRLKAAGVIKVQVTIDGPAESHDASRKLDDSTGTFETVIKRIKSCTGILDVVVRINVNSHDASRISRTLDYLGSNGILAQNQMYLGTSWPRRAVCADVTGRCCLTDSQAKVHLDFYRSLLEKRNCRIDFPYLTPRGNCGQDSLSSLLVAPTGYLYKSWTDISPRVDESIGSVFVTDVEPFQQTNLWPYLSRDLFDKQECRECDALPACLGACLPSDITDNVTGSCSPWKNRLRELVTLRYLYNKREEVNE